MWFLGNADVPRREYYKFRHIKTTNAVWDKVVSPYSSTPLSINPLLFAYAATRASILGPRIGLRGHLAGAGLATASLSYLTLYPPKGIAAPPTKRIYLHHNFANAKDFVASSIKGTIGAAIAYLEMQGLGYAWSGHWEDCVASTTASAYPDFVFASANEVCLVDAKGSASAFSEIGGMAKSEWKRQIYSNAKAKMKLGGAPTEGRVIASALTPTGLDLVTAHGKFSAGSAKSVKAKQQGSPNPGAVRSVQRVNYTNAFFLLGLNTLASALIPSDTQERVRRPTRTQIDEQRSTAKQQAEEIDNGERVYLGPSQVLATGTQRAWTMQPFCRTSVIDAVVRCFLDNDPDAQVQATEFMLPINVDAAPANADGDDELPDRVVFQSRDGVGMIFTRLGE
ncbi:hypothetical protein [Paraburkholderia sp. ZP32-5]|uniref:hypothetical protein n=1 Tax=Paraburkholderia sp. ZP32-5 TaxID=2883245 RepID=UPI001F2CFEE4|nr:hypothetical protein [Paraburkholderia sp. ZP32-5]